DGRVPRHLALDEKDVEQIARVLAAGGPPLDRSRFDRRRVLAATEQVMVTRWRQSAEGMDWLEKVLPGSPEHRQERIEEFLSPDWPTLRRSRIEGIQKDAEAEPFPDDEDPRAASAVIDPAHESAWHEVLSGKAGQDVL